MNANIQIFSNNQFGQIRTITDENGEPQFCLKDLCEPLGLQAKLVKQRLDDKVVSNYPISDALGRQHIMVFVNEEGLYDVILESRKPEAREFRRWVTGEVLPSIRKHGAYITPVTLHNIINDPDTASKLIEGLADELCKEKTRRKVAEETVKELLPKSVYVDMVLASNDLVDITQIAQDYGMTAIRFNQLLHRLHIQFCCNGQWILYAEHKNKGYTHSHTLRFNGHYKMHTRWTQEGRLFLYDTLKDVGIMPLLDRENVA